MKELDNFDTNRMDDVIASLLARQVDGIIWVAPEIGDNHAWVDERLDKIPVPVCSLPCARATAFSVWRRIFPGGEIAIKHLLDCGRKRIGHISGPLTCGRRTSASAPGVRPSMLQGWITPIVTAPKETGHLPAANRHLLSCLHRFRYGCYLCRK